MTVKPLFAGLAATALTLALAGLASAQAPDAMIAGKLKSVAPSQLTVATAKGETVVKMAPDWAVMISAKTTIDKIQPGSFVGATNVDIPGGGRAVEVHVFPPGSKPGEGQRVMDAATGSKMTNGTVGKLVKSANGREMDISFPGGTRHVVVPANAVFTTITPAERSYLKPGMSVAVIATPGPKGPAGRFVSTGVNGAPPPR